MHKVLKSFQLLLVFLLLLGISCSLENNPDGVETAPLLMTNRSFTNPDGGGIALTFDDAYIAQWYAIKDLLQQYSARATFFVSHFLSLSAEQVQQLRELKAAGNEIGFHGVNHIHAVMYLNAGHTITEYLNAEIFPGITAMRNAGLFPTSFAYPYGENNLILNSVLLHHFDYIRDTSYTSGSTQIADLNACYYSGGNQRSLAGIGIDTNYGHPLSEIYTGMDRAAQAGEHSAIRGSVRTGFLWHYPAAELENLIKRDGNLAGTQLLRPGTEPDGTGGFRW